MPIRAQLSLIFIIPQLSNDVYAFSTRPWASNLGQCKQNIHNDRKGLLSHSAHVLVHVRSPTNSKPLQWNFTPSLTSIAPPLFLHLYPPPYVSLTMNSMLPSADTIYIFHRMDCTWNSLTKWIVLTHLLFFFHFSLINVSESIKAV